MIVHIHKQKMSFDLEIYGDTKNVKKYNYTKFFIRQAKSAFLLFLEYYNFYLPLYLQKLNLKKVLYIYII